MPKSAAPVTTKPTTVATRRCAVCERPAAMQCGRCKHTPYCGVECQRWHWKDGGHKQECRAPLQPAVAVTNSKGKKATGTTEQTGDKRQDPRRAAAASIHSSGGTAAATTDPRGPVEQLLFDHTSFCIEEAHRMLLSIATNATSVEGPMVKWVFGSIANLPGLDTTEDPYAPIRRPRDLVVALAPRTRSPEAVASLAGVLSVSSDLVPEAPSLFATVAVRDALLMLMPHATTADAVLSLSDAIVKFARAPASERLYATTMMRDALVALAPHATTAHACLGLACTIMVVCVELRVPATPAVRDALVTLTQYAATADTVRHVSHAIYLVCNASKQNRDLFVTATVRDALVALAPRATTADAAQYLGAAFFIASKSQTSHDVFATPAVRGALVALAARATTGGAAEWVSRALRHITCICGPDKAQDTFATVDMHNALVTLAPRVATADATCMLLGAISNITESPVTMLVFGTAAMRDALVILARRACVASADAVWYVACAICNITRESQTNRRVFATVAMRDALVALLPRATTHDAYHDLTRAIRLMQAEQRDP